MKPRASEVLSMCFSVYKQLYPSRPALLQEELLEHLVGAQHTRPRVPHEREHKEVLPDVTVDIFVCSKAELAWLTVLLLVSQSAQLRFDCSYHCGAGAFGLSNVNKSPFLADIHLYKNTLHAAGVGVQTPH